MTFFWQSERNLLFKCLPYFAMLLLLVMAAWYFTSTEPVRVQLAKVERGVFRYKFH